MRCRMCNLTRKNTGNRDNWNESGIYRTCFQFLGTFSLNCNYLKEY